MSPDHMGSGIIDPHIHLWDPWTTPRTVSPAVKLLGRSDKLLRTVATKVFPRAALDFVGKVDEVTRAYLPGVWHRDTGDRDVRGFVHVQADWQGKGPLAQADETAWLETVCGSDLLAVIGRADLESECLDELLDAHAAESDRFVGIRDYLTHPDGRSGVMTYADRPHRALDERWQRGLARLGQRGLTFDAWCYGHQLSEVAVAAAAAPETTIVLDHLGSPIAIGGPFAEEGITPTERADIAAAWRSAITALAAHDNVVVKLSGQGMPVAGHGWHHRLQPPPVSEVVQAIAPLYDHVVEAFEPARCMLASNFPMDRVSMPWSRLYDAYESWAGQFSAAEQRALFHDTAATTYGIGTRKP